MVVMASTDETDSRAISSSTRRRSALTRSKISLAVKACANLLIPIGVIQCSANIDAQNSESLQQRVPRAQSLGPAPACARDRKSTRLNSSHRCISYAVFCLKKKKKKIEY